jgi:hypothetical protein
VESLTEFAQELRNLKQEVADLPATGRAKDDLRRRFVNEKARSKETVARH